MKTDDDATAWQKGTGMTGPSRIEKPGADILFSLYERQERIANRLNRKIERLDKLLWKIEERMEV